MVFLEVYMKNTEEPTEIELICRICQNAENNKTYIGREMMFGTRDKFEYFQCGACGCLQISNFPDNIGDYYPKDYYSFRPKKMGGFEAFAKKEIALNTLKSSNPLGRLLRQAFPGHLRWLNDHCNVDFNSRILDVGTGQGNLLLEMRRYGFKNLTGIDPFIEKDIQYKNGVNVLKKELRDVKDSYDLIMLHHSLEHMPDQEAVFDKLRQILNPEGRIVIRVPVADSAAWEKYGVDWVEMDPPRHYFLHTKESMDLMAGRHGMEVKHRLYDSSSFEIIGSEKWKRDIPSNDPTPEDLDKDKSKSQKEVELLNKEELGCRACFYIGKR